MIIYFSGTGNSRFAAEFLAKELNDETMDAGAMIKAGEKGRFHSEKPYIFVAPTYCWRMPKVFENFLLESSFSGSKASYFVLTCGMSIGAAGKYLEQICEKKDLDYQGTLPLVMPENYIAMFQAPGKAEAKKIVEKAKTVLEDIADQIRQGSSFRMKRVNPVYNLISGPINEGFNRYFLRSNAFYVTQACIGCSKCVNACVLNNISMVDGKPSWGKDCTQCMACICGCPTEAIEYGKKSVGKVRYWCPEV